MLLALLENGQQEDGSVVVPAALTKLGAPTSFKR
jgi:seryl-tRNA synthetase